MAAPLLKALLAVLVLIALALAGLAAVARYQAVQSLQRRDELANFYAVPSPLPPGRPGRLLRAQPVNFAPGGARGWRGPFRSPGPPGRKNPPPCAGLPPPRPGPPGGPPRVCSA